MRDDLDFPSTPAPWPFPPVASPLFRKPQRPRWKEYGRPAVLFLVTLGSVYFHAYAFFGAWEGVKFLVAVMSIMLAHEFGHYFACRYYRVDASLPHFLPAPPVISLIGTFGAFIRIRQLTPHRKALFDIGVAGPLAGFIVCLPLAWISAHHPTFIPMRPDDGTGLSLNMPLLYELAMRMAPAVETPSGMVPSLGPLGFAVWFGALLTMLNLMPVGQLDGGHMVYALLRRNAAFVSRVGFWTCLGLVYFSPSWIVWAALLFFLGRGHPTTADDDAPVGAVRVIVGLIGLAVLILCFMPSPIVWGTWPEFYHWLQSKALSLFAWLFT